MKLNSKVACTRHAAHHPPAEERVSKCKARRQSRRRASTSSLMHRDPEPLMMSPDHPDEFRAMKRITFYLSAALLCLAGAALAQEDDQEQKRLSAEILWQLDRLGEPVVSPQGRDVVVPATSFGVDSDGSETRLWLLGSADEPGQRPISAAGASASIRRKHRAGRTRAGRADWALTGVFAGWFDARIHQQTWRGRI